MFSRVFSSLLGLPPKFRVLVTASFIDRIGGTMLFPFFALYMACFDVSWSIPSMIGPAAAGLIMDNTNPNWVWYLCGIIAFAAAAGFYALHYATQGRFRAAASEA